jgi:hypothetical protein
LAIEQQTNRHSLCRLFADDDRKSLFFVPAQAGTVLLTAPGFSPGKQDRHTRLNIRAPNGTDLLALALAHAARARRG